MSLSQTEFQSLEQLPEEELLGQALRTLKGRVAIVSSFGAESAVLLALAAKAQELPETGCNTSSQSVHSKVSTLLQIYKNKK